MSDLLKKINPNIEYLSVGGENLKLLGIKSILVIIVFNAT